jgi:hypothetical protein
MSKPTLVVFPDLLKSHVQGYTRKDGAFVKEHDDNRRTASGRAYSMAPLVSHPIYSKHVEHEDGDGNMTTPLAAGHEHSTAKALRLANPDWTADDHENLAKDHKKKALDIHSGTRSMSPKERMSSGASTLQRAHERLSAGHARAALDLKAKSSATS